MKYKLIALDIDGTLLNSNEEMTPRVRKSIKDVQEAGLHVTLATGRRNSRTLPWAEALGLSLPLTVHNGAVILDPVNGEVLQQSGIPVDLSEEIFNELRSENVPFAFYTGDSKGDKLVMEEMAQPNAKQLFWRFMGEAVEIIPQTRLREAPL